MTTLREAAQQALEALDSIDAPLNLKEINKINKASNALRAALEATGKDSLQVEPVAWMDREGDIYRMPEIKNWAPPHTLLYTAPPQREWQGLTDEEIDAIDDANWDTDCKVWGIRDFARAIEAKLKEKNT